MMMLIGLRAVVKRGISVVTVDHALPPQEWVKIPFSLKQISPVAHIPLKPQDPKNPVNLMATTFAEGWRQLRAMQHYLDLPAYDDIRRVGTTPSDYEPVPWQRAILWMCSFQDHYLEQNYKRASQSLSRVFGSLAREKKLGMNAPEVKLIIDIISPRLMSQRTYEAIRRHELCVVDWTQWRANVFYEFGVRLAVSDQAPICLLDPQIELADDIAMTGLQQHKLLKELFTPHIYDGTSVADSDFDLACQNWDQQQSPGTLEHGSIFREVCQALEVDQESASLPLHRELIASAYAMTGVDQRQAGDLPILYAKHPVLNQRATQGSWQRLLAAWRYVDSLMEHCPDRVRNDATLQTDIQQLATQMLTRLSSDPHLTSDNLRARLEDTLALLAAFDRR
jgi:hypothetical protein